MLLIGSIYSNILVDRGIRQGDPLSPFLFVLFLEILSRMITKLEDDGKIQGIKVARLAPSITYLFFADDILILCKASPIQAAKVISCLENFCDWTGQNFNPAKFGCFFSSNIRGSLKVAIKNSLNMRELGKDTKYLGNIMFPSRIWKKDFESMIGKMTERFEGWKATLLSQTGRATLVKHMVSAMPLYSMAATKIPSEICNTLEKSSRAFLWRGNNNDNKGWNPGAWDTVCKPKSCGGLGLRKLSDMNLAMLGKIGCSLATDTGKLWVQVLKAKYFPHFMFMGCRRKKSCSRVWPAILNTRSTLRKGLCFKVGKGNNINYWEDPWVPNLTNFKLGPKNEVVTRRQGMVQSLLNQNGEWNKSLINEIFDDVSVKDICEIFWANLEEDDKLIWIGNKNGNFLVKSFYWIHTWERERQSLWWKKPWSTNIHERHKFFIWKLANKGLSVKMNLIRRGLPLIDNLCMHGCPHVENKVHLLFKCQFAKGLWFATPWGTRWEDMPDDDLDYHLDKIWNPARWFPVSKNDYNDFILYSVIIFYHIWWVRNEIMFKDTRPSLDESIIIVRQKFFEFKEAFDSLSHNLELISRDPVERV